MRDIFSPLNTRDIALQQRTVLFCVRMLLANVWLEMYLFITHYAADVKRRLTQEFPQYLLCKYGNSA